MQERRQRVGSQPQGSIGNDTLQWDPQQDQQSTITRSHGAAPTPLSLLAARRQASRRTSGSDGEVAGAQSAMPQPSAEGPVPMPAAGSTTTSMPEQQPRGLARLPSRRSSSTGASGAPATTAGAPAAATAVPAAFPMPSLPPLRTSVPAQAAWRTRAAAGQQQTPTATYAGHSWSPAANAVEGAAAADGLGALGAGTMGANAALPWMSVQNGNPAADTAASSGYEAAGSDQAYQTAGAAAQMDVPVAAYGSNSTAPGPVAPPSRFMVYDNPLGADNKGSVALPQPVQPLSASDHMGRGADGAFKDQDPHGASTQHSQHKQGPGQQQGPFSATHSQQQQGQQQGQGQQPMVFNADTGLLTRGEGRDHTHVAHHYIEDWSSGQFYELQEQPGCFACCRRRRPMAQHQASTAEAIEDDGGDMIASTLHALERFAYVWADWTGLLGLFVQGLCGGLALLCLFMSYLMYLGSGTTAFLAYYAPLAQNLNRAYFTLVSLSLVASVSKWATDKLAQYAPKALRLRAADAAAAGLYIGAYICNLLATPLDDQLTYEAQRDPAFWRLPMPSSFTSRLSLWHALNLARIGCCAFAWLLCCYMASPHVVCAVVAARRGSRYAPVGVMAGEGAGVAGAVRAGRMVRGVQRGQEPSTWEAVPPVAL